jgi:hypothetical protein
VLQGRSDLGHRIVDSAVAQFPVIGDEIGSSLSQSRLRGSGLALAVGVALALWGGLAVGEAAQAAMNGIWNVPRRRYPNFLLRRLRGLAWLVILGGGCCWPAWSRDSRPPPTRPGRARRRWPRSLAPPPLGGPDERALEGLARQEERLPDQRVEVSFGGDGEAGAKAEGEAGERPAERGPPAQTR